VLWCPLHAEKKPMVCIPLRQHLMYCCFRHNSSGAVIPSRWNTISWRVVLILVLWIFRCQSTGYDMRHPPASERQATSANHAQSTCSQRQWELGFFISWLGMCPFITYINSKIHSVICSQKNAINLQDLTKLIWNTRNIQIIYQNLFYQH